MRELRTRRLQARLPRRQRPAPRRIRMPPTAAFSFSASKSKKWYCMPRSSTTSNTSLPRSTRAISTFMAMGIVVDNSGSMREKRQKVNAAALNLVRSSNPNDEVFIVNFNDEYYLDQDFTSNINKLKEGLEKIETRGGTALYDAVVASADHLKKDAKLEKKVIFVVTDGDDNESSETLEQAVRRLQAD